MEILAPRIALFESAVVVDDRFLSFIQETSEWKDPAEEGESMSDGRKAALFKSIDYVDNSDPKGFFNVYREINMAMWHSVSEYVDYYSLIGPAGGWEYFGGMDIKQYELGGYHTAHTDDGADLESSNYSIRIYVTEDFEGGELKFYNHDLVYTPKAGDLLIYPSGESHASLPAFLNHKVTIQSKIELQEK